jgi:ABC-type transporter Mla MlaB component
VTTFYVEGKLTGDSVDELRRVWLATRNQHPDRQTVVNLSSLFVVDTTGKSLLSEMHGCGTQLAGRGIMIRPLIDEICGPCRSS